MVGLGADVSDAQFGAALRPGVAAVVAAVVGQDPFDGDATFGEPGHSPVEERDEDDGVLDAGELAAGRPGVGVDDGVDVVVALASGRTGGYPRGGQRVCSQHWATNCWRARGSRSKQLRPRWYDTVGSSTIPRAAVRS